MANIRASVSTLILTFLSILLNQTEAASLITIREPFGPNPTNVTFNLYLPPKPQRPLTPLMLFPHWCHGTAQDAFSAKPWRRVADELGFAMIFPSSPWQKADGCWDVSSPGTLKHDSGSGDSQGLASMVRWAIAQKPLKGRASGDGREIVEMEIDPDRVFVAGVSSGAMMANVMAGAYPELFAAASGQAGVPFGCFAAPAELVGTGKEFDYWSDACAKGKVVKTGHEWSQMVGLAYPGYSGPRPKIQIMHGSVDEVLDVKNYYEQIKLWTTVLEGGEQASGSVMEPTSVTANTPQRGWTKNVYGTRGLFEAFLAQGVSHNIPDQVDEIVRFFDLNCTGPSCFSRKSLPTQAPITLP